MSGGSQTTTVIDHIVLLKFRPDITDEESKHFIDGINSLSAIPGVLSITVGSTFVEEEWMSDRRNGYTHSLICRLHSKEALKVYQDHPLHIKVKAECIAPYLLKSDPVPVISVDHEAAIKLGEMPYLK